MTRAMPKKKRSQKAKPKKKNRRAPKRSLPRPAVVDAGPPTVQVSQRAVLDDIEEKIILGNLTEHDG